VELGPQVTVIPAEVKAGAAATEKAVTLADGYAKLHCSAATVLLEAVAKDRVNGTKVPELPVADDRLSVVCPQMPQFKQVNMIITFRIPSFLVIQRDSENGP